MATPPLQMGQAQLYSCAVVSSLADGSGASGETVGLLIQYDAWRPSWGTLQLHELMEAALPAGARLAQLHMSNSPANGLTPLVFVGLQPAVGPVCAAILLSKKKRCCRGGAGSAGRAAGRRLA